MYVTNNALKVPRNIIKVPLNNHHPIYCSHYLKYLSPPIGEVALLQLLQLSSRSVRCLRNGMGTYDVWLLLLGRY